MEGSENQVGPCLWIIVGRYLDLTQEKHESWLGGPAHWTTPANPLRPQPGTTRGCESLEGKLWGSRDYIRTRKYSEHHKGRGISKAAFPRVCD